MTTKQQASNIVKMVEYTPQSTEYQATAIVKMVEYASSLSSATWTKPDYLIDGDFITASTWNTYVVNNLLWFGGLHDHSGDPGDGALNLAVIPQGVIAIFDTSCPDGWTVVTEFNGLFLKGSSSYGATGGEISHYHPQVLQAYDTGYIDESSSFAVRTTFINLVQMTYNPIGGGASKPLLTGSSTVSTEPPNIQVVFCKKD